MVGMTVNQLETAVINTEDTEDENSSLTPSLLFFKRNQ